MKTKLPDGWHDVTGMKAFINGQWVSATRSMIYIDGWKEGEQFVPGLSVSVSPSSLYGFTSGPSAATIYAGTVVAIPNGGLGPFTYLYEVLTVTGGETPIFTSATLATTTVRQNNVAPNATNTASMKVTVTDSLSNTASTIFEATFTHAGNFS